MMRQGWKGSSFPLPPRFPFAGKRLCSKLPSPMSRPFLRHLASLAALVTALFLTGCETTENGPMAEQQIQMRRLSIASETPGDYYVGRRFYIERTHFWGYVRRPGESWDRAKLVVMNERQHKTPDRLPEIPSGDGPAFGYDHNREYRLWGHFSGQRVYDPNSNLLLPEFVLQRWEVKNESPGWLFKPNERFDGQRLLRGEVGAMPGGR